MSNLEDSARSASHWPLSFLVPAPQNPMYCPLSSSFPIFALKSPRIIVYVDFCCIPLPVLLKLLNIFFFCCWSECANSDDIHLWFLIKSDNAYANARSHYHSGDNSAHHLWTHCESVTFNTVFISSKQNISTVCPFRSISCCAPGLVDYKDVDPNVADFV